MTNEEAMEIIYRIKLGLMPEGTPEALTMAINVLEQQPCEDCISRQAVLNTIGNVPDHDDGMVWEALSHAQCDVALLPSVTPKPTIWIPVKERLPEETGIYITTVDYGNHGLAVGQRYYHGNVLGWEDDCVIAWMPLPEPYKAESEEADDNG